jgi:hypothetical protein
MAMASAVLPGLGNAIKLLPTGTVFLYQFFSPVFSNYGKCHTYNKYLTAFLVGGCGFCCFFTTFTDSYVGDDGKTHYGLVTNKGLWPSSESRNLSAYKLKFADFVHASLAIVVFAVVVLLDANSVKCFYPVSQSSTQKHLLMLLPAVVGAVSSLLMALFPYKRHGLGYPSIKSSSHDNSNSGGEILLTKTEAISLSVVN